MGNEASLYDRKVFEAKNLEELKAWLNNTDNINSRDENGWSALHWAAYYGWTKGVIELMEAKVETKELGSTSDLFIKNVFFLKGVFPLDVALLRGKKKCAEKLKSYGITDRLEKYDAPYSKPKLEEIKFVPDDPPPPISNKLQLPPKELKLVLIDMDQTMFAMHTQGYYVGDIHELSLKVSDVFLDVVPRMIEQGYHVAIVTFSDDRMNQFRQGGKCGDGLVRQLITHVFTRYFHYKYKKEGPKEIWNRVKDIHTRVHVACAFPEIHNKAEDTEFPIPPHKEWHIAKVLAILKLKDIEIENHEIALFDDTDANVEAAAKVGIHGYKVDKSTALSPEEWEKAMRIFHDRLR